MKKVLTLIAILLAAALLLSACGADQSSDTSAKPESASSLSPEESKTQSSAAEPVSQDPVSQGTAQSDPESSESAPESSENSQPERPVEELTGGDSIDSAQKIETNVRYRGRYKEGEAWFSFRTGNTRDAKIAVTLDNLTEESGILYCYLTDSEGAEIKPRTLYFDRNYTSYQTIAEANDDGRAGTGLIDTLETNTTYYLRIQGSGKARFSLCVTDRSNGEIPETEERETILKDKEFFAASNQDDAPMLLSNVRYEGKYEGGYQWLAFRTGETDEIDYSVTLENLSAGSDQLNGYLYDQYGALQTDLALNYSRKYSSSRTIVEATGNGRASTGTVSGLESDSLYFLCISGGGNAKYSIRFTDPKEGTIPTANHRDTITGADTYFTRSNQDEAPMLLANTRYEGMYEEGYQWVAFTTGSGEGQKYTVTLTNLTPDSEPLKGWLYDEYGTLITELSLNFSRQYTSDRTAVEAAQSGETATGTANELEADSIYYLCLSGSGKTEYALRFGDPEKTAYDPATGRTTISQGDPVEPASNSDEAPILLANTACEGEYTQGYQWFAFRTGAQEDAEYKVTLENLTVGSELLCAYLYDSEGTLQTDMEINYSRQYASDKTIAEAAEDGKAGTGTVKTLKPNSVYTIRISGGSKAKYKLTVTAPQSAGQPESPSEEEKPSAGDQIVPGTSQSSALNIPLNTKVFGKYINGNAWIAFTTTETQDALYRITAVNCTVGSARLCGYLYDEEGTQLSEISINYQRRYTSDKTVVEATEDGRAATGEIKNLSPNTKYYLRLLGEGKAQYSILVSSPSAEITKVNTSSSFEEAKGELSENEAFYTGTNQNIATLLKKNTKYHGKHEAGAVDWVAFTTGEEEGAEYKVTLENLTVGSERFCGYLYDEYGTLQTDVSINFMRRYTSDKTTVEATEDGKAATGTFTALNPNSTYYLGIWNDSKAEYMLTIGASETGNSGSTIEQAEFVFDIPFELNETQVRFLGDLDVFVDEAEAKAALEPVAKIILENPGHPILIAGTTATVGKQEDCLELSEKRAAAVKNLLVQEFGVPEDQLITIGLGYADDPFVRGRDLDSAGRQIETEAAKNRRVVVLDADSATGKQILKTE